MRVASRFTLALCLLAFATLSTAAETGLRVSNSVEETAPKERELIFGLDMTGFFVPFLGNLFSSSFSLILLALTGLGGLFNSPDPAPVPDPVTPPPPADDGDDDDDGRRAGRAERKRMMRKRKF